MHYRLLARPVLYELLRRQRDGQLHPGLLEPLRHRVAACRSRSSARSGSPSRRSGGGGPDGAPGGARERARLSVRGLDAGARRRSVSGLRLVRRSRRLVCVLCLITYAAVIGLFLVSGAATSVPMMTLPRRAVRDLKVLVVEPARARARRSCSSAARRRRSRSSRARRAAAPRRAGRGCRRRRDAGRRRTSAPSSSAGTPRSRACRSSCRPKARRCWSSSSTITSVRRAGSRTWTTRRSSRSTRRRSRARSAGPEGLSARVGVQRQRARRPARRGLRGGGRGAARARAQPRPRRSRSGSSPTSRALTPAVGARRRRATSARSPTSTRSYAATLEQVKADIALRPAARRHARRRRSSSMASRSRARCRRSLLRPGDCLRAASAPCRQIAAGRAQLARAR